MSEQTENQPSCTIIINKLDYDFDDFDDGDDIYDKVKPSAAEQVGWLVS